MWETLGIYICNFPEPRPIRDRWLTKVPPLCSPANPHFVDMLPLCSPLLPFCSPMLPLCSPILPHCSPLLPRCSLILPLCSPVLPLSHFLLFSYYCVLASVKNSPQPKKKVKKSSQRARTIRPPIVARFSLPSNRNMATIAIVTTKAKPTKFLIRNNNRKRRGRLPGFLLVHGWDRGRLAWRKICSHLDGLSANGYS